MTDILLRSGAELPNVVIKYQAKACTDLERDGLRTKEVRIAWDHTLPS